MSNRIRFFSIAVLTALSIYTSPAFSQSEPYISGMYLGIGSVYGNSPQTVSYTTDLFFQTKTFFNPALDFRFGLIYGQDIDQLSGENRTNRYYPFVKGASVQLTTEQYIMKNLFMEEGTGLLFLNDRTFSDVNTSGYGVLFSIALKVKLFEHLLKEKGFSVGVGTEYGLTFTNTLPGYYSVHILWMYTF